VEKDDGLEVFRPGQSEGGGLPPAESNIKAGFPSPADDFLQNRLDLNEHLVLHPAATFFVRVAGDSMAAAGISDGDILIVDRSLEPGDGRVVIAVVAGELMVKRLRRTEAGWLLAAENDAYPPIEIGEGDEFEVWGVVTNVIHRL
jgi:DNA polymerase V